MLCPKDDGTTFNEMKLLSFPKGGSYNEIDDIRQIDQQFDSDLMNLSKNYTNTRVTGAFSLSKYRSCLKYSSKVKVEVVGKYARCSSATCGLFQAIDDSNYTFAATIMLKTDSDTSEVRALDNELRQTAQNFERDISLAVSTRRTSSPKYGGIVKLKNQI